MEEKYYEALAALNKAQREAEADPCMETEDNLDRALFWYRVECTNILEQLIKKNPNILKGH